MHKLNENECKEKTPLAYFLYMAANDQAQGTAPDRIDYLLATHGSHLSQVHVDAILSLDQDRVTQILVEECIQGAIPGIANGLVFNALDLDARFDEEDDAANDARFATR